MVNAQHTPFCKNPLPRASSTALALEVLKVMLQGPGGLWDHGEEQPVPKALLPWGTGHTELKQEGSFLYCLGFFLTDTLNFHLLPTKAIRNNQNSCYSRWCQWILRVCRNSTVRRTENPSMTLSAYLMLLLLCVLDKESGVRFLRKKTRCVYKCCHWQGCCYSDSPALTGSLGNWNASFPQTPAPTGDQNWSWLISALSLSWTAQWQNSAMGSDFLV